MKISQLLEFNRHDHELIAIFGEARLVRHLNGRHELVGGTADDRTAALEWCSMFAHDLVFSTSSKSLRRQSFAA